MAVGWTGHRPEVFKDPAAARRAVRQATERAITRWPAVEFVTGGQRGVDQWSAAEALALGIPLHIVLPTAVASFTSGWLDGDRSLLNQLIRGARSVTVVDEDTRGSVAYDLRNEAIVRRSDLIIAVWTGARRGGTFHTLCAAWARGVPVEETRLAAASDVRMAGRGL